VIEKCLSASNKICSTTKYIFVLHFVSASLISSDVSDGNILSVFFCMCVFERSAGTHRLRTERYSIGSSNWLRRRGGVQWVGRSYRKWEDG